MTRPVRTAELSGSESALVIAALFALAEWPFETASARKLVSDEHKVAGQRLSEIVSARWQAPDFQAATSSNLRLEAQLAAARIAREAEAEARDLR